MYRRVVHRRYRQKRYSVLLFLLLLLVALTGLVFRYNELLFEFFISRRSFDALIEETAQRHNLDSRLLKALIWQESRFDPNAKGSHGEIGLMQIRPEKGAAAEWALVHGIDLPPLALLYNPRVNLEIGSWYLARMLADYPNLSNREEMALSAYNAGPSRAREWAPTNPDAEIVPRITIRSTRHYVNAIMNRYHQYCLEREADE